MTKATDQALLNADLDLITEQTVELQKRIKARLQELDVYGELYEVMTEFAEEQGIEIGEMGQEEFEVDINLRHVKTGLVSSL